MRNKSIKWIDIDRTFNLKIVHSDAPECSGLQSIKETSVVYVPRFLRRNAAEFGKMCMSDNIRNKGIFENKIAKIAQNLPKFDILRKMTLTLHNGNVFANSYKKVRRFYNV